MSDLLEWPTEVATELRNYSTWHHTGSNFCLDFHGNPAAQLVVYSDGNHHMALAESLQHFAGEHGLKDIFYATTPPGVLAQALAKGGLRLGNLELAVKPHVFISPAAVLDKLVESGRMTAHQAFSQSRGNVLLFRYGNPFQIQSAGDLNRSDVRLFLSNPKTETASYTVYRDALASYARQNSVELSCLTHPEKMCANGQLIYGECIHHREAPLALASNSVDVAVVYYHLALRYTRIFPQRFAFCTLDGEPAPAENGDGEVITRYHAGLIDDGGKWGSLLLEYLLSETVSAIYQRHGLRGIRTP